MYQVLKNRCPLCSNLIIEECPTCHKGKVYLKNHCQFRVKLSNQTEVYVATCRSCFTTMTDEDARGIWEGIKVFYAQQGDLTYLNDNVTVVEVLRDTME